MIYQNFFSPGVEAILLGLSTLLNLYNHCTKNRYCQLFSCNSHHCLIIHPRMSTPFPPRPAASLVLPVPLLAPPALPSLGECFPFGSVDLGKYYVYSSAHAFRIVVILIRLRHANRCSIRNQTVRIVRLSR